jgi:hypothetical protein
LNTVISMFSKWIPVSRAAFLASVLLFCGCGTKPGAGISKQDEPDEARAPRINQASYPAVLIRNLTPAEVARVLTFRMKQLEYRLLKSDEKHSEYVPVKADGNKWILEYTYHPVHAGLVITVRPKQEAPGEYRDAGPSDPITRLGADILKELETQLNK